jgi:DNA (cytosine-5)-methyltransferase 1
MNELALFAGGGGGIWGSLLLGHTTVCAVEIVEANRRILLQRQLDGIFPRFPIWDDVRTFDGREWRGKVDIVSGGFPCQDISCAGKGAGIDGERSGLWSEMARIIGEVRPRYAFIENSPMLVTRGLDRVLCDLAAMGFDAEWGIVSAADVGAPHLRERIWVLANANGCGRGKGRSRGPNTKTERLVAKREENTNSVSNGLEGGIHGGNSFQANVRKQSRGAPCRAFGQGEFGNKNPWEAESRILGICDGVPDWKHRIFSLGNAQVPRVAAAAWRILSERAADGPC